jgi:glucan phosphoethanolaminetransferase (alkaline phosphatase superfamily)
VRQRVNCASPAILLLSFGVAGFLALTGNLSFFRALLARAPDAASGFLVVTGLILVLALGLVLTLFALPYLWKPAAIVLLLVAAVCAHFMDTHGTVIDRSMVQNIFETDVGEAGDLITTAWRCTCSAGCCRRCSSRARGPPTRAGRARRCGARGSPRGSCS